MAIIETIEPVFRFLEIITTWPVIFFIVVLLFRKEIHAIMPELAQRLKKITIGQNSAEFTDVRLKALIDAIKTTTEEYKDDPEELVYSVKDLIKKVPEVSSIAPENTASLSGSSILWVDDKPMNNVYETSILKRLGASIIFARSTEEALKFLNQDTYDLIISDILRVEEGTENHDAGYELLDELHHQKMSIPLVFYTGNITWVNSHKSKRAYAVANMPDDLIKYAVNALKIRKKS